MSDSLEHTLHSTDKKSLFALVCRHVARYDQMKWVSMNSVFFLVQNIADGRVVPWWGYLIFAILFFGGLALIVLGLMGPSNRMEKWADAASTHWASLIIMVLAYPIYLVISPFYAKR